MIWVALAIATLALIGTVINAVLLGNFAGETVKTLQWLRDRDRRRHPSPRDIHLAFKAAVGDDDE